MTQKLSRRLEELEKSSAAAAARQALTCPDYEETISRIRAEAEAWHADPVNQKWLAEQPPEYFSAGMQQLKARLAEMASGHERSVRAGGL